MLVGISPAHPLADLIWERRNTRINHPSNVDGRQEYTQPALANL